MFALRRQGTGGDFLPLRAAARGRDLLRAARARGPHGVEPGGPGHRGGRAGAALLRWHREVLARTWCPGTARASTCRCSPTARCCTGCRRRATGRPAMRTPLSATTTTSAAITGVTPISWTCCRGFQAPRARLARQHGDCCSDCPASSASTAARCGRPTRPGTWPASAPTARPTCSTPGSSGCASRSCAGELSREAHAAELERVKACLRAAREPHFARVPARLGVARLSRAARRARAPAAEETGDRRRPHPRGRGRRARRQDGLRRRRPAGRSACASGAPAVTASTMTAQLLEVAERRARARAAALRALRGVRRLRAAAPGPGGAARAPRRRELRENLERVARVSARALARRRSPGRCGATGAARASGAKFVRKKGRVLVGFRERAAPYVAELERCEVLAAPAGELISAARAAARYAQHPRAAAADRGGGGRQRHRAGAARAGEPRGGGPRAAARLCRTRTACASTCRPAGLSRWRRWMPARRRCDYRLAALRSHARVCADRLHPGERRRSTPRSWRARWSCSSRRRAARVLDLFCGLGNFTLRARAPRAGRGGRGGRGRAHRARARQRRRERHRQRAVSRGGPVRAASSDSALAAHGLHARAAGSAAHRRARGAAGARGAWRPSGCCIFPAIREVWHGIWECWCTSTA